MSDVKRIAEITHKHGIPLIVDEAHGAHFRFSEYFPVSAVDLGADVVVQSFHKTLPSMTQTAVLHICSDLVEESRISRFLDIYETSSPSYILMASLDACVDKMKTDGIQMFREFTGNLEEARKRLGCGRYIRLFPSTDDASILEEMRGIFDYDRSKLIFTTVDSSLNGPELSEILRREFHLEMEMSTADYVIAVTSVGDTRAVSYTHLDVYKRQSDFCSCGNIWNG